jgi:hypothetical protein
MPGQRRAIFALESLEDRTLLSVLYGTRSAPISVPSGLARGLHIDHDDLMSLARRAEPMATTRSGSSIKQSIVVGTVVAGRTKTFSGSATKQKPATFYKLFAASHEMVHASLSVQKGGAKFTIMGNSGQVLKSLSLPGPGTANWTFGPGTYYLEVSHTGKPTTGYQLSFGATSDTATSVGTSSATSVFGETLTFTATVRALAPSSGPTTGAVTFMDGSSTIGTATLGGGTATLSTSALTVGNHSITVSYIGGGTFNSSGSSTLDQVVNPAQTSTAVAVDVNPSDYGQTMTFTASVSVVAPGSGIPTGTVTFMDGSTSLGTESLNGSGSATFSTSALATGSHAITAIYNNTTKFKTSTSPALEQVVNPAQTATALAVDVNPSVYGQTMTFTASVSVVAPGSGIPTGAVTFMDGSTPLGIEPLAGSGTATFSTSALAGGSHAITAVYNNTANFKTSTSPTLSQVVHQASSATNVSVNVDPGVYGQPLTFTVSVSAVAPGGGVATGTVDFSVVARDGSSWTHASTLGAAGTASFTPPVLSPGSYSITASYSGDGNFQPSASATSVTTVNQASSATNVYVNVNPGVYGQALIFTVAASAVSPGGGLPTGTVTFTAAAKDGTVAYTGTEPVNSDGIATFTPPVLAAGPYSITASYSGDSNFQPSVSATTVTTVNQASTATNVTVNVNPGVYGQALIFTVTASAIAPGGGMPTGVVNFSAVAQDGSSWTATGTLDAAGTARFALPVIPAGAYSITAAYLGDSNFHPSTSATTETTVNQAATTLLVTYTAVQGPSGALVNFNASVSAIAPGSGIPTGTVTFMDGSNTLGIGSLGSAGTVNFSTILGAGAHSITVSYGGDANFELSAVSGVVTTASQAGTSVLLTASASPSPGADESVYGQAVTFTALVSVVAPGSGIPTGTVTFMDGSSTLGVEPVDGTGTATFTTTSLGAGTHAISAIYGGDANFSSSTSAVLSQVVSQAKTAPNIAVNMNPGVYGQPLTFTVTVSPVAPGGGVPTGTVTLSAVAPNGSSWTGTENLDSTGTATFTTSALGAGANSITASYLGDTNFSASTSPKSVVTVNAGGVTVQVTPSVSPVAYQVQSVTFTATVSTKASGAGTPDGTVQFQIDGNNFGQPVPLANGSATSGATSSLSLGSHTITAIYVPGESNFQGGTSLPQSLKVEKTEQQIEAALDSQIHDWVHQLINDVGLVELSLLYFYGATTPSWIAIDADLIHVDDLINGGDGIQPGQYTAALQYIQGTLGPDMFWQALLAVGTGNWALSLLNYPSITTDLQHLSALKEIGYGFLVYLAFAIGSEAQSSPSSWTTGVLCTGSSDNILSPSNQAIFTTYSTPDWADITTNIGNLMPDSGILAALDQWNQAATLVFPNWSGVGGTDVSNPVYKYLSDSLFQH